jgi:hypothetical protein
MGSQKARCSPPREKPNKWDGGWRARDRGRANTRVLEHLRQKAQILGTDFPRAVIHNQLEIDLLPYFQIHHSSALDSANVDVDVESTVIWLEETVALPGVEPYYGSSLHRHLTVTADKHGQGEEIAFSVFQSSIAYAPKGPQDESTVLWIGRYSSSGRSEEHTSELQSRLPM